MKSLKRTWLTIIILLRVIITIGVMMALFWAMWIGYFTLPIILVGLFFIILAVSDIGILVTLRNDENIFWKNFQKKRLGKDPSNNVENDINDYKS